ncbi:hypothetical protein FB451DRAFT_1392308 [Mycena latifolia]|nr:hypothetical protein FB451DRAFT_1392308 [Mycena latifolia]
MSRIRRPNASLLFSLLHASPVALPPSPPHSSLPFLPLHFLPFPPSLLGRAPSSPRRPSFVPPADPFSPPLSSLAPPPQTTALSAPKPCTQAKGNPNIARRASSSSSAALHRPSRPAAASRADFVSCRRYDVTDALNDSACSSRCSSLPSRLQSSPRCELDVPELVEPRRAPCLSFPCLPFSSLRSSASLTASAFCLCLSAFGLHSSLLPILPSRCLVSLLLVPLPLCISLPFPIHAPAFRFPTVSLPSPPPSFFLLLSSCATRHANNLPCRLTKNPPQSQDAKRPSHRRTTQAKRTAARAATFLYPTT